jgi:hypothetical protein
MYSRFCCFILLMVIAFSAVAKADTIYNNLLSASSYSDSIQSFGPLADSFSTGPSGFILSNVQVLVSGDNTSAGSFSVLLLADNSTSPGASLLTLGTASDSSLSSSPAALSFSTTYFLDPNTRYWIELIAGAGGTSGLWAWTQDQSAQGVAGEYVFNVAGVFSSVEGPYQMELSGSAVPEPGTLVLFGSGLIGSLVAIRRRLIG